MQSNTLQRLMRGLSPIVDMLYPPRCAGCQRTGFVVCDACLTQMTPLPLPVCPYCGIPVSGAALCPACRYDQYAQRPGPRITAMRAAGGYEEPLRSCIRALKYDGNTRLAEPLGLLLAQAYQRYALDADAMIPVPLHRERLKQRGYNHAALLAEVCARHLSLPYSEEVLMRQRNTASQVGLNTGERRQNVLNAFAFSPAFARSALTGKTLVIVDDVCTSGATLEACSVPLFAAGAKEVWGLTLAKPVR
jgi:ComF family protein